MKEYKKKWNKYKAGEVPWINTRREHPGRQRFINYITYDYPAGSILEIGGGELIEARKIVSLLPDVKYSVADVSDSFLKTCEDLESITGHNADMINLPFTDKKFDLVFMSSVLEHSPDIISTIAEVSRVSNAFYFSMFKWKMKTGDLKSQYHKKKQYFSSMFNIDRLLELIKLSGVVQESVMCFADGRRDMDFDTYRQGYDGDDHRTGDHLAIMGKWV